MPLCLLFFQDATITEFGSDDDNDDEEENEAKI